MITAAISTDATPPRNGWIMGFEVLGNPMAPGAGALFDSSGAEIGSVNLISPEYFAALRIPMLQGRIWSDAENNKGAHVAVINRTLARRYFPNRDAIGHSLRSGVSKAIPSPCFRRQISELPGCRSWASSRTPAMMGSRNVARPAVFVPSTLSMEEDTEILVRS